jgi:hypothetical protein
VFGCTTIPATVAAVLAALVLAAPVHAALPRAGVLVPGESLGGIGLGMSKRQVGDAWGRRYGVCRSCAAETWLFTYRPFTQQGAAVEFRRGRVARIYTLWQPAGWNVRGEALAVGDAQDAARRVFPAATTSTCGRYSARTLRGERATSAVYLYDERVWGFGLILPGLSPCVR